MVNADTFNLSVAGDFDYAADFEDNGTVTTNALNLTVGGNFTYDDVNNDFTWVENDSLTVLGNASVTTDSFNNSGNISANSFDITATDLTNSGTISANTTFNTTVASTLSGSFNNTGGVVNADTFNLSVAGDFDYAADFEDNGTVTTNVFNLTVGGNFTNDDASSDFTWRANDILTVLGNANITANNYNQYGAIDISAVFKLVMQ